MLLWIVNEVAQRGGINNARELAARTGLPATSVYRIWKGSAKRTDLRTLDRLCTVLQVKPCQLFDHDAEPDKLPRVGPVRFKRRKQAR